MFDQRQWHNKSYLSLSTSSVSSLPIYNGLKMGAELLLSINLLQLQQEADLELNKAVHLLEKVDLPT